MADVRFTPNYEALMGSIHTLERVQIALSNPDSGCYRDMVAASEDKGITLGELLAEEISRARLSIAGRIPCWYCEEPSAECTC